MRISFFFFFLFFINFSVFCFGTKESTNNINPAISLKEQNKNGHFIIRNFNNELTVLGISNKMLRHNDEIISAKEDAARKIAMYFGIQGRIEIINSTGSSTFDYFHNYEKEILIDENYENFLDQLTFDPQSDVLKTNEGVFISFKYKPTTAININYNAKIVSGRPSWTRNHDKPGITGYVSSVGFSRTFRYLKDTVNAAVEDAIATMIADLSTQVNAREVSVMENSSSSVINTISEGRLINFQIIEIWFEPGTRSVFVLAIAKTE